MLQNARVATFAVSELLKEMVGGRGGGGVGKLPPPPHPDLGLIMNFKKKTNQNHPEKAMHFLTIGECLLMH